MVIELRKSARQAIRIADGTHDRETEYRKLQDAFELFNQLSRTLTDSYRELEGQVARLNRELAAARSERLKALTEKEKLATKLQRLLEVLPGGVIVLDGQGRINECNPAAVQLLGEPLVGEFWTDISASRFAEESDNPHERRLTNGRTVSISASQLFESESSLESGRGQILLLADVSEMRTLQELLDQHKRLSAMGEMVAELAHQVRTPLATAILYASHLQGDEVDQERRRRFAGKIVDRLHHLERQVNDMLIYSRKGRFATESVSVADFLQCLRQAAEPLFVSTSVELVFNNPTFGGERFRGNAEVLEGGILNLLNNALEAVGERGRVEVRAQRKREWIVLSVIDDGEGMEEAVRARIFEPFFTTRASGTGLGLAVVDGIVRAFGGFMRCDTSPGGGAAFHIHLPPAEEDAPLPGGYHDGRAENRR
ncbi:MAG: sensor histidine kinase [Methylohalobius sp. ZOD2]|nr:PAS domain-containing protein [Methylothermaceae bacterium]